MKEVMGEVKVSRLRQWLSVFDAAIIRRHPFIEVKKVQPPDLNDLAFNLAIANDISEALPTVITSLQQTLDEYFSAEQKGYLSILFSNPGTSESFLHHGQKKSPSSRFIQGIHRRFTQQSVIDQKIQTLRLANQNWKIYPQHLLQHQGLDVWMLLAFPQHIPTTEKIQWRTHAMAHCFGKGIQGWYQREDKIAAAVQTERSIYAAELHDSLAQVLGYLRLKSAQLDKRCQQEPYAELKPITEDLAAYTHCAYRQTRELIASSRLSLKTHNLSQGIVNSIKEFEQQSAIVFELDNRLQRNVLMPKQAMQVLYIIRESLSNIVRHSHASHARLILTASEAGQLTVVIEDNGTGIDPLAARNDSFGLKIMHERAERINARLMLENRPEGGTRISLSMEATEHVS